MKKTVSLVGFRGVPAKVLKSIVGRISVIVAARHSRRARPDKGHQDEPVDKKPFSNVIVVKRNPATSPVVNGLTFLLKLPLGIPFRDPG